MGPPIKTFGGLPMAKSGRRLSDPTENGTKAKRPRGESGTWITTCVHRSPGSFPSKGSATDQSIERQVVFSKYPK